MALPSHKLMIGAKTETADLIRILGISGSGRRGSYNTALLEAAKELAQESITIETFDISKLPLYSQDLEAVMPAQVREFKKTVKESDSILFAVPEHNYTVTAVMKNALEWGARPPSDNSWNEKPCAMMSASSGPRGGARAQLHLRQILVDLNMHPINRPLLLVANEADKFDSNMRLTDSQISETLRTLVTRLEEWTRTLQNKREKIIA